MAITYDILKAIAEIQECRNCMQCIEPSAGLIYCLANKIGNDLSGFYNKRFVGGDADCYVFCDAKIGWFIKTDNYKTPGIHPVDD